MRIRVAAVIGVLALSCGRADAQYSARADDPCAPAARTGNPILDLASAFGQQRRSQACATERQAQWADYNAKQKAAKDQADAKAAALAKSSADQAAAEQARVQTTQRSAVAAHARAAETRARRAATAAATARLGAAREAQASQAAETARRLRYVALIRAEASPENTCRTPKLARGLLEEWSGLDAFKDANIKAIDIEHLTTVYLHPDDQSFACHGVFVTNTGLRIIGTATVKHNVAGDPMFVWARDASQDLSAYNKPAAADALSPEMATQSKVHARVIAVDATASAP